MTEPISCSFCGTGRADVRFMMEGPAVAICGDCVCHAVRLMASGFTAFSLTIDDVAAAYGAGMPVALPTGEFTVLGGGGAARDSTPTMGGGGAAPGMKPTAAKGGPT